MNFGGGEMKCKTCNDSFGIRCTECWNKENEEYTFNGCTCCHDIGFIDCPDCSYKNQKEENEMDIDIMFRNHMFTVINEIKNWEDEDDAPKEALAEVVKYLESKIFNS